MSVIVVGVFVHLVLAVFCAVWAWRCISELGSPAAETSSLGEPSDQPRGEGE